MQIGSDHQLTDASGNPVTAFRAKNGEGNANFITFDLWVAGVQVTGENKEDVLGNNDILNNGVFSYNPSSNTLMINGSYSSTGCDSIILNQIPGLTILVTQDSELSCSEPVNIITAENADTTIMGSSKLKLTQSSTDGGNAIRVSRSKLKFQSMDVEISTAGASCLLGSTYMHTDSSMEFIDSVLRITAPENTPAITGFIGGITLSGCRVAYPNGAVLNNGEIQDVTYNTLSALTIDTSIALTSEMVLLSQSAVGYTGSPVSMDSYLTVKDGETVLVNGTDYTTRYMNHTNMGMNSAYLIIEGKGKYAGNVTTTFSILPGLAAETVTGTIGSTVSFKVTSPGSGYTYQWQYNAGDGWQNSGDNGAETDTLSVTVSEANNGCKYRCMLTAANGNEIPSVEAVLLVRTGITAQPASLTKAIGTQAKFTVTATGIGLTYQWQYNKGDGWKTSNGTGSKTNTLTINTAADYNGYQYRCIVTAGNGTVLTSEAATLKVKTTITAQPANLSKAIGEQAKFTVTATGAGLTYQWQYNKGEGWKTSNGTGSKTNTLTINTAAGYNNYQYRCVITDANGAKTISSAAKLTVNTTVTAQPKDTSAAINEAAKFTVKATGAGLKYQWQYNSGEGWKNSGASGATTATLSINAKTTYNGWKYSCVITDANGATATSSVTTLKIRTAITAQPADTSAAINEAAKFTVKATGVGLKYQWQYNSGDGWKNSGASGNKTARQSVE